MSTKVLRILLADDHEVVRRGLRSILETQPEWEICGEAATGREAVEKARQLKPDVVVLDISMPELNGLEAARQMLKELPQTEVLILTMHESEDLVGVAVTVRARGFMLKSDAGRDLVAAVKALAEHKPYFTSRASEVLLQTYVRGEVRGPVLGGQLTPREREVIQLLAEGKSNKEIATVYDISVKTVEAHRANIMRKLNLHAISDLVRYAIRNKIIAP